MTGFVEDLSDGLPDGAVVTDSDLLGSYRQDEASFCPSALPMVAVLPRTTEQVQHVLRTAAAHAVPVVPQGARTGLAGAANALPGCVVLSLTAMKRIVEVNRADRYAVVEPGVLTAELSRAAAEQGLRYPPDPSSWETSTIGGNLATNAGGLCCVKYGVTADFVLGLEVVLASGDVLRTGGRTVKGVAGYDLTRLFVGSEGTLGVITQATVALRPAVPIPLTLAAVFPTTGAAGAAVSGIVSAGCIPSLLEILDRLTLRAVDDWKNMGIGGDAAALLLAQSDAGDHAPAELAVIAGLCRAAGASDVLVSTDPAESTMLLAARRLAYPALARLGATMVDDVAVPRSRLADFLIGVEHIAAEAGLLIGVVGHAGDGNMHPTVVFDRDDAATTVRARAAFDSIMALGLELGGTITGEHGVGLLKRDWLARELGPVSMGVHLGIKAALDPLGLLNPGKVLPATASATTLP